MAPLVLSRSRLALALVCLSLGSIPCGAATFVVTNTGDSGPGSLRQAILDADGAPGADGIVFSLPGTGYQIIRPSSTLFLDDVSVDGFTQPGASGSGHGVWKIALDGSGAGPVADGLVLGSNCTVRGLSIYRYQGDGVVITGSANRVESVLIGVDLFGTPTGNVDNGIHTTAASSANFIGAPGVPSNQIAANGANGVLLEGEAAELVNSAIGLPVGNGQHGVFAAGSNNRVGLGPTSANHIAANGFAGVALGAAALGNDIHGNDIFDNGGLGIDHMPLGIPDVDPSPPSPPVLNVVLAGGASEAGQLLPSTVSGYLQSEALTTYRIDVYRSYSCDPSGFGEGLFQFEGASFEVTTDAVGFASFHRSDLPPGRPGWAHTATATSLSGAPTTSEFSACTTAIAPGNRISCADRTTLEGFTACVDDFMPRKFDTTGKDGFVVPTAPFLAAWRTTVSGIQQGNPCDVRSLMPPLTSSYDLVPLTDTDTGQTYCALYEALDEDDDGVIDRGWGTFIYNPDPGARPFHVQIVHPLGDAATDDQGIAVFKGTNAGSFVMAGAHRYANDDASLCQGASFKNSDVSHNVDNMIQEALYSSLNEANQELPPGVTPTSVFLQFHGMGAGTCGDVGGTADQVNVYLTYGSQSLSCATDDRLLQLQANLLKHNPAWNVTVPGDGPPCNRSGTDNPQGRLLNGVELNSLCSPDGDATSVSGRFIHIEQDPNSTTHRNPDNWIEALISTFDGSDGDGDGLFDDVDQDAPPLSGLPDFAFGTADGRILNAGGQVLFVYPGLAAGPGQDPFIAAESAAEGVWIRACSSVDLAAAPATVSACGGDLVFTLNAGREVRVACGVPAGHLVEFTNPSGVVIAHSGGDPLRLVGSPTNGLDAGAVVNGQIYVMAPGEVVIVDPPNTPESSAPVVVQPVDESTGTNPVAVTFSEVAQAGVTTLSSSPAGGGPPPPANFQLGDPALYYDLSTTALIATPIEVCFDYGGIDFGGGEPRLLHYESWGIFEERVGGSACYAKGIGDVSRALEAARQGGSGLRVWANEEGFSEAASNDHVIAQKRLPADDYTGTWRYEFYTRIPENAGTRRGQSGPEFSIQHTRPSTTLAIAGEYRTVISGLQYSPSPWEPKWRIWRADGAGQADCGGPAACWEVLPQIGSVELEVGTWYRVTMEVELTPDDNNRYNTFEVQKVDDPDPLIDLDLAEYAIAEEIKFSEDAFWLSLEGQNLWNNCGPGYAGDFFDFQIEYDDVSLSRFNGSVYVERFADGFETDEWVDITSSLDAGNEIVCGEARSLSPFALATPAAPQIALVGEPVLALELNTAFEDPGAAAQDALGNDLTDDIQVAGEVDVGVPGTYTVIYSVANAAGAASVSRTVHVVITPNSYVALALNSLHLGSDSQVLSGFVGVQDRGRRPFVGGNAELVMDNRSRTAASVQVSARRAVLKRGAEIAGTLSYSEEPRVMRDARIIALEQRSEEDWPLVTLPEFRHAQPGSEDVVVRQRRTKELGEGAYGDVVVRPTGSLQVAGGEYRLRSFEAGQRSRVSFLGPASLLVEGTFTVGQRAYFGPAEGSDVEPSAILVYVQGTRDKGDGHGPRVARVESRARFLGNLYAPEGTIWLRQRSTSTGSFIAHDLIVGAGAAVHLRSGWATPAVIYDPVGPAAAKSMSQTAEEVAGAAVSISSLEQNYPNPFNATTTIAYRLAAPSEVRLVLYNLLGQRVRVLVEGQCPAGQHLVVWDGRDAAGELLSNGMYIYRLTRPDGVETRRLMMMK